MAESDRLFAGSIPQLYEQLLVPLIFEPYARDLAQRLAPLGPADVLEVAAGTGVVTRRLAESLPSTTRIVATDLNAPMLQEAQRRGTARPVEWQVADAMQLPFDDDSFDAVACQFGVMFFPDRGRAFAEMRRVLRPGGVLLFNAWDAIAHNEFADVVTEALVPLYPQDPPRFMARTPHGYHDPHAIARDLGEGGFTTAPDIVTLTERSCASGPEVPAMAYCQGTPLRNEIEARGGPGLLAATQAATQAIAARFGIGEVDGKIQALVVSVRR
ncbi:methyltransferase domain-containing protein [Ramlibacter sp. USB13]|uniref:Methyltransferase domain-containing protein n=1 Tax=Ramlibacter cellulosilyticus TaxID=2764187 RepID=A0A923SDV0_9BURK|nr:methyltransferase domain-containing protein [Ramlibacter cellulosilyticus]MBC5785713.1 methyltransferase domain-containing protein [Ramlibacter cellulosilyticus]